MDELQILGVGVVFLIALLGYVYLRFRRWLKAWEKAYRRIL